MVKVKICGLTRPQDIETVNAVKPDYVGFVFAESKRRVTHQQAAELRKFLSPDIIPVGVFVSEPTENILENILQILLDGTISVVQLHGGSSDLIAGELRRVVPAVQIIRAVSVEKPGDAQKWESKLKLKSNESYGEMLLLDNKGGGTGQVFDWSLIGRLLRPYFLAGGLTPENIEEAIARTAPFAVDVSSGVETGGVKDPEKIRKFINKVRKSQNFLKF